MFEEFNPFDKPELVQARKDQEDPWVMYLIVRESLNMGVGKIAAQVGHSVGMMFLTYTQYCVDETCADVDYFGDPCWTLSENDRKRFESFQNWCNESYRKIVLKADDKEWEKIKKKLRCFVVRDAGLTEIEAGSETVIGLWPMRKSEAPKVIKKLQILK